jgi:hypothetical protein
VTPNQQSVRHLRNLGFTAEIVELRIPGTNRSRDLFGVIDIVAIGNGQTLGVQATTADHVSHRRNKINESGMLPIFKDAGWLVIIHGWRKDGRLREEVVA